MYRVILFIFIIAALMLSLISIAMYKYIIANQWNFDAKVLNMLNLASDGNKTGTNSTAQNTQPHSTLSESEKVKNIEDMPTKCRGSALCPDYDYYPSSF